MKTTLGHIGINLPSEESSFPFWQDLLTYLKFTLTRDGNHFDASDGHTFLCFSTAKPDYQEPPFHRKHTGLNHIAFQIEGGETELRQLYGRLVQHGAKVDYTTDHGMTHSVYFFDPDGNLLEIFSEVMDPEAGRQYMREGVRLTDRNYKPEPILSA